MPLLRRCLENDVRRRLQSEARLMLKEGLSVKAAPTSRSVLWPVATLSILVANATFTRLTDYEGVEVDVSVSPDGKFVPFLSDRNGPFNVWLHQTGTGNARKINVDLCAALRLHGMELKYG